MNLVGAQSDNDNKAESRLLRRKPHNFFHKGRIQSRFVPVFIVVVAGSFILYLFLAYYLIDRYLTVELYRTHLQTRPALSGLFLWWPAIAAIMVISLISLILVYIMTRRMERRLDGFARALRRLVRCDLTGRIDVNKAADGLSVAFNRAVSSLDERFASIKRSSAALEYAASQLRDATGGHLQRSAAQTVMADIAKERANIMEELAKFSV